MLGKRRNRLLIALLLNIFVVGLGHLFLGKPRRGGTFFCFFVISPFMLELIAVYVHSWVFVLLYFLAPLSIWIYGLIDVLPIARAINDTPFGVSRARLSWYGYVLIIIIYIFIDIAVFTPLDRKIAEFKLADGHSMGLTILDGEGMFIADILKRDISPGDVVSFTDPYDLNRRLVKRIVAEAGQSIEIRNDMIYVNGKISSSYEQHKIIDVVRTSLDSTELKKYLCLSPTVIPAGHVFVIGDNFYNSIDSRIFGPISCDAIKGKVLFIFFSSLNPYDKNDRIILRIIKGLKTLEWDRMGKEIK
jgi:signal peptidase I